MMEKKVNLKRKALDLAREHKGVSSILLSMKLKLSIEEAEHLAKSTNEEYRKRVENTKRTRFQPAVRAPLKRVYRKMTKLYEHEHFAKTAN